MELGIPVVIAVNMMDAVRKSGDQIHIRAIFIPIFIPPGFCYTSISLLLIYHCISIIDSRVAVSRGIANKIVVEEMGICRH